MIKFFCLFISIFFLVSFQLHSYTLDDIICLLEAGKFQEVEEFIKEIRDENKKIFINSIYYLYLGDYEKAYNFLNSLQTNNTSEYKPEEKFFFHYIPYIYHLFKEEYKRYESQHFVVFLKGRDEILKDIILENLEKIYVFYNEKFNYYPKEKIRVEVYDKKKEFCNASTLPEEVVKKAGVVGICKFNRIMILSPENLPYGYRWIDTLAHEYVHFLLNRITEYKYPLYLHEATAKYFDTLYRSTQPLCFSIGNLKELLDAKRNNRLIPFENLKGSLVYLDSQQEVELAFIELASFLEYIINNFGENKFIKFVHNYINYKDEKLLYRDIFNKEYTELIKNWIESIEEKKELVEKYPGALMDIKILNLEDEKELLTLESSQYIELGDMLLRKKQYKAALYQYKKSQQQQPYNPIVMTRISKVLMLLKDYKNAEEILKQCIMINPNFSTAYELIVELYYETSQYHKALEYYKELLQINPFNYKIRKIIAEIYSDLGKLKEALYEYKIVSILNPEDKNVVSIIDTINRYLETKQQTK
ncbi:MAG: tetratricopeptide repeat protein [Elusimicrobiota bacterium]|nr:tetratricopeptide repeat protein [Endomicrobiia bacterium]MDW8165060.1 tetratricopeptide repeat protein [Elusimicrobiota bacterium]